MPKKGILPELPPEILTLITQKKTLRRRRYRVRDSHEYATLGAIIRNLDKIIQERITIFEQEHYLGILQRISPDQAMFRQVKNLSGVLQREKVGDLINLQGQRIISEDDKANLMAEAFENIQLNSTARQNSDPTSSDYQPAVSFGEHCLADGSILSGATSTSLRFIRPTEI